MLKSLENFSFATLYLRQDKVEACSIACGPNECAKAMAMTSETLLPLVSDAALLQRIGEARDKDAFAELFLRHQRAFYSLAYRLTGHRENAEEAVQDAACRIWRSALSFRPEGNARAWMFRIVARSSFRRSERRAREISLHEEENMLPENSVAVQPSQHVEQTELVRHLQRAVDRLSRSDQRIVSLYFGVGMTQREVSETLDIPQTTVSYRLGQILKDLRNDLSVAGFATALPMLDGEILGHVALDGHDAPAGFVEKVLARLDAAAKTSVRAATASVGSQAFWVGAILMLALVAAGLFMGRPDTESLATIEEPKATSGGAQSDEALGEVARPARWKRRWEFNIADGTKDLRIIKGAWRWAPNDGPDGSGCMVTTEEKVAVELKLATAKLPLLLTVDFRPELPEPLGGHLCSGGFNSYDQAAVFHNIGIPIRVTADRPKWLEAKIFLAEGVADIWSGGRRTSLVAFENPGKKLYLLFRGRQRLDNIQIQEIGLEHLPDASLYLDALRRIPPDKRTGTIPVPELESASPGKQVAISFANFESGKDGKHGLPDR